MQVISQCPVCSGHVFTPFLSTTDYAVSHETFHLLQCKTCSLVFTSPQPYPGELHPYYQSDNYISHSTKARTFFDRIYRLARIYNVNAKIDLVKSQLSKPGPKSLLDFGCGTGEFLLKAKQEGFHIAGVEPSQKARSYAEDLTKTLIAPALIETMERYEAITLWHVLEHIPDLNNVFHTIVKCLAHNGTMFIAVPNHQSHDARHYGNKWAGYDVPRHLWHFNTKSMTLFLANHSLKLRHVIPMKLDAFYVSILSEQYLAGRKASLNIFRGFMTGLRSNWSAAKSREFSSLIYIAGKS